MNSEQKERLVTIPVQQNQLAINVQSIEVLIINLKKYQQEQNRLQSENNTQILSNQNHNFNTQIHLLDFQSQKKYILQIMSLYFLIMSEFLFFLYYLLKYFTHFHHFCGKKIKFVIIFFLSLFFLFLFGLKTSTKSNKIIQIILLIILPFLQAISSVSFCGMLSNSLKNFNLGKMVAYFFVLNCIGVIISTLILFIYLLLERRYYNFQKYYKILFIITLLIISIDYTYLLLGIVPFIYSQLLVNAITNIIQGKYQLAEKSIISGVICIYYNIIYPCKTNI